MKVTCGHCGRKTEDGAFCEKCGAAMASAGQGEASGGAVAAAAEQSPGALRRAAGGLAGEETAGGAGRGFGRPLLEVDRMCVQFEGLVGTVRFRVDPGGYETVKLTMEDGEGGRRKTWGPRRIRERGEIRVQLDGQAAGCPTWTVRLECAGGGKRQSWEGDVDLVVARPREAQRVADNLKVEITNHITLGNASDAHVNQRALDGLEKLATAENPFDVLKEVVCGSGRSWARVELFETGPSGMPEVPAGGVTDRLVLRRGEWTVRVFSGTVLRFGRNRPAEGRNDFTLRPGPGGAKDPFLRVSQRHCFFRKEADGTVALTDGARSDSGVRVPSSNGTWWNGTRLEGERPARLGTGATGWVSFGGAPERGAVTLRADMGGDWLLLRRTDGVKEAILWLWGDFDLGLVEAAAEGTTVSRKEGGFAWRRRGQRGWLVPGTASEPGDGTPILVEKAAGRM